MPYTFEELSPILAALKLGRAKIPQAKMDDIIAKITPEEMDDVRSKVQISYFDIMEKGVTVETIIASLKADETMWSYIERVMPLSECAKLVSTSGLAAKDVKILRDLCLPKSAQVIEYALPPPAPPKAPHNSVHRPHIPA